MTQKNDEDGRAVSEAEALALHNCITVLMRSYRIEPGLLAGSVYEDLHANDLGLFGILAEGEMWSVQRIADALSAPVSTISSALDRLESKKLVERRRSPDDRRVVQIALTKRGQQLAQRLHEAHVGNCRAMLARLNNEERGQFLRFAARIAGQAL